MSWSDFSQADIAELEGLLARIGPVYFEEYVALSIAMRMGVSGLLVIEAISERWSPEERRVLVEGAAGGESAGMTAQSAWKPRP